MPATIAFNPLIESYGALTIDEFTVTGQATPQSALQTLQAPPLNQPMLGTLPVGAAQPLTTSQQAAQTPSTGWGLGWFMSVYNALKSLIGGTQFQTVTFECPSIDDSDVGWGVTGSINATDDPAVLTVIPFGTSKWGRVFEIGDYILWDDPKVIKNVTCYEIDQITAIKGNQWTLARAGSLSTKQQAQFGSAKFAHETKVAYRMVDGFFTRQWNGGVQTFKIPWDNMTVAAVLCTMANATPQLVSCFQQALPTSTPPCPGIRTLTGNEYAIGMSAKLEKGAIADNWLPITGPESIRSVFVSLSTAPVGGPVTIFVIYRTPDKTAAGVIDILNVQAGEFANYDITMNRPDQRRQMPYHDGWSPTIGIGFDYPPNVLPNAVAALLPDGNLDPTYTGGVDNSGGILFEEGGWWSYICTLAGKTVGGQVDTVTLQT